MRGAILAHQTRTINCKHNIQVGERHIDNCLINAALQKRRVNSNNRFQAAKRKTRCQANGVAFRNAGINEALREFLGKTRQARTRFHGGGYGNNALIFARFCH